MVNEIGSGVSQTVSNSANAIMDAMSNAIVSADFMQKLEAQKAGAVTRPEEPPPDEGPRSGPHRSKHERPLRLKNTALPQNHLGQRFCMESEKIRNHETNPVSRGY